MNQFAKFLIAFILSYAATVSAFWGMIEACTYFTGDELRKSLAGYWVLLLYGAPIPIALVASFKATKHTQKKRQSRSTYQVRDSDSLLGENPEPLAICRYLQTLVVKNTSIIQNSDRRQSYAEELVQNLQDGIIRIYCFGHQNAGKSSLINALLSVDELSPTFPGKMTTCLVRIRWGKRSTLLECYSGEVEDKNRDISKLRRKMEEWSDLPLDNDRPREVIIEIPNEFLKNNKFEMVDSPGTGSGQNKYGKSLEDEIVDSGLKSGALAIVVYRDTSSELEAHEKLVRHLGDNDICTVAVCNLDPNWASEIKQNKRNIQATIARAEKRLRDEARAKCYRIAIKGDEYIKELARQEGGITIEEFRISLIELLDDRKKYAAKQAIRSGHALIEELLQETGQYIREHQPYFDQIEEERKNISEAILCVREVLNKGYEPSHGTAWGTAVGTASTLITGAALSLVTAGTYFLWAAAGAATGAAVGYFVDKTELEDFKKRLADKWTLLQKSVARSTQITRTKMITQESVKKVQESSSSLSESRHKLILNELDTELNTNLQKIEGYNTYRCNKYLNDQLLSLKEYF